MDTQIVKIRLLTENDLEAFWKLRLEALQQHPDAFGESYEEAIKRPKEDIIKNLNASDTGFIFGAFMPNLIGLAAFYRQPGIKKSHKGIIWSMYVDPNHRGKGLGKDLLKALIDHASTISGLEQLLLSVVTTNDAAHNLYLSLGFRIFGTECKALKLGENYIDEDLMVLDLNHTQKITMNAKIIS